jgi:hypothetical protein
VDKGEGMEEKAVTVQKLKLYVAHSPLLPFPMSVLRVFVLTIRDRGIEYGLFITCAVGDIAR